MRKAALWGAFLGVLFSSYASAKPVHEARAALHEARAAKHPAREPGVIDWLRAHVPSGGDVEVEPGLAPLVVHTVREGDTAETLADRYLVVTDVYTAPELARAIAKENAVGHKKLSPGARVVIPRIVTRIPSRAALPPMNDAWRGVYVRGETASRPAYVTLLDKVRDAGMNAIVLDIKDYDGKLTYPSAVPLAVHADAIKHAPIADLARTIRFAHDRGIRVIARVSCFNDEFLAKARPALSVQSKAGRPYPLGWLDPSNEDAQSYLIDLAREAMAAGADEIELDYVRYPVVSIKNADFHLEERGLTKIGVVTDFVKRVHAVTKAHGIPLSLDVFGIIALGKRDDIERLGQDPALLVREAEALSPMVYPSHFGAGMFGLDDPGAHPEVVGMAVKKIFEQLAAGPKDGKRLAVIRPWVQAATWNSPGFGSGYIAREIQSSDKSGGHGWLMWNPGQQYHYAWPAVPHRKMNAQAASKSASR